ncbi:hypothetical protein K4F52_001473 [Lecanicillium sp. MT-2017a]|nr:hypothetical protein K4F52_001473 [Lecanicillium sp. MT-2017a]
MSEVVGSGGVQHLKVFEEAVRAHSNLFSGIRKYDRADFDRWWGEYDAVLEMPCFLGMDALEAYIEDRDVKFILMERDPDSWVASWNNTVPRSFNYMGFPSNILNYFDLFRLWILRLNATLYLTVSNGTLPGDPHNRDIVRRFYTE